MTKEWFLIEEANQNMDVAMACADALYAFEQLSLSRRWEETKIRSSIENCRIFLKDFAEAIKSMFRSDIEVDPFLFTLAGETARNMGLRPKELLGKVEKALEDFSGGSLSSSTQKLLDEIIQITQRAAIRKCESIKPTIL